MRHVKYLACGMLMILAANSASADYAIALQDKGLRDYYCTITVRLQNNTDAPLTEINGHFFSFVGEHEVGRSKGASFMNVAPGEIALATFETPNAPCEDVTSYRFVIGACRVGAGFIDKSDCAALIETAVPIDGAAGF